MSAKDGAENQETDETLAAPDAAADVQGNGAEPVESEPSDVVDAPDALVDRLASQVSALEARLRTVSAAYKEQQDELRATRERIERQAQAKEELRRGEVVQALFEPFENLRRSIAAVRSGAPADEVGNGLEIVETQILDAFRRLGLEEVPGKGARFDPGLHEAIATLPVTDPALDDIVIDVFSAGYRIGSRLIQPARVVIGKLQQVSGEA